MEPIVFKLVPIKALDCTDIDEYRLEFAKNGESENVTWELAFMPIYEWYARKSEDMRNRLFGFNVNGRLVGMARISTRVNFDANGKIGYSIRPSERGKRYGKALLIAIETYCKEHGISPVTACVDVENIHSFETLRSAGYRLTGRTFDWIPNPNPRKAVEMALR